MAGRRLLDIAQIFTSVRKVASNNWALQYQQTQVYAQSSSVIKSVKNQTDRVTVTVGAAFQLAKRLADDDSQSQEVHEDPGSTHPTQAIIKTVVQPSSQQTTVRTEDIASPKECVRPTPDVTTRLPSESRVISLQYSPSKPFIVSTNSAIIRPGDSSVRTASNKGVPPHIDPSNPVISATSTPLQPAHPVNHITYTQDHSDVVVNDGLITPDAPLLIEASPDPHTTPSPTEGPPAYKLRESKVPVSQISRLWHYGTLFTGMAVGVVGEGMKRAVGGTPTSDSIFLSPANLDRLVAKLSRMRGAALKVGQMLSIQDLKLLPGPFHDVFRRVQDSADYMPAQQRDKVLVANLGTNWRDLFSKFDELPMAAASIGQVHRAVLKSNSEQVAVKIQYPGVATSIDSDLDNLSLLLTASKLLPKGMFLDKTIANARTELAWECDYSREAACSNRFRELLSGDNAYVVPKMYPEACGKQVLTTEFMNGVAVTRIPREHLSQEDRDWVGEQVMRLCFREIADFQFMQTDPNWTNFLYQAESVPGSSSSPRRQFQLIDFGASRAYPFEFIAKYVSLLKAAAVKDKVELTRLSIEIGYLTGHEEEAMKEAHVESILILAEPFSSHTYTTEKDNGGIRNPESDIYDFSSQTLTDRIREQIPVMLAHRQVPPPEETYSLHRKLSGAFLLCSQLGARVKCRSIFEDAISRFDRRLIASKTGMNTQNENDQWLKMGAWGGWVV